jgi:hypothetical protein
LIQCIKEPTLQFSRGGKARPLISEVIPALESLRRALNDAANSTDIADICRVAAYGGGLVLNKYLDLVPECEAYEFAIGMFSASSNYSAHFLPQFFARI